MPTLFLEERDKFPGQSPVPSILIATVCEVKNNEPKQQKKKVTMLNNYLVFSVYILLSIYQFI